MKLVQEFVGKEDIMEEKILNKFKKIGYVVTINEYSILILHNPTNARTIYLFKDNSFVIGIGFPHFAGPLRMIVRAIPTFKEKRLIKKLIKLRKEKTNENNFNY